MAGFIKFDGIDGEVADGEHKNWIEWDTFSLGISKTGGSGVGSKRNAGTAICHDVHITKNVDKSSPKLFVLAAQGTRNKKVEIHQVESAEGRKTYLVIELTDVMVSSYSTSGTCQSRPSESLSLNFTTIKVSYKPVDAAGKLGGAVEAKFDTDTGKAE